MREIAFAKTACFANGTKADNLEGWRRPLLLVVTGCAVFAMGALVYLTDRGGLHPILLPTIEVLGSGNVFGVLGQWLPSFVHPFSFSLFTVAALPARLVPPYGACAAWCAVNIAFEAGQHPQLSLHLADAVYGTFGRTSLTWPLANYFLHGTFDVGDIVAAILGALAAAGVLHLTQRNAEVKHAL
jgi:hypothetical protein